MRNLLRNTANELSASVTRNVGNSLVKKLVNVQYGISLLTKIMHVDMNTASHNLICVLVEVLGSKY